MYLIATNEYLVNIISYMFFDFFSPFCTFANGQKYQKYEESLVSKFRLRCGSPWIAHQAC